MARGMRQLCCCALLVLLTAFAPEVKAQHLSDRSAIADQPIVGCGKARELARRYRTEHIRARQRQEYETMLAAGLREAFDETDLLHCELEIEIDPSNYTNLSGTNTMTIESLSETLSTFTFRLRNQYNIDSAIINADTPSATAVSVTTPTTTTRVATLDRTYTTGETFTLTINYSGHAESRGFGSIEFATHGSPAQDIVYSLSEPYFSYTWWPVKDGDYGEPGDNGDKFTLDLAVIAPDNLLTASNGTLLGIDTLSGSRARYRWSSDYPISPYLVCFASTNYNTWSVPYTPLEGSEMDVLFYIYPESDVTQNRDAWGACVDMLYTFRDFFGEYPFVDEKYGIYQCEFGGGMEHQTFTAQGGFGERLTAHELAHQWWGNMITCKTWSDIWLNEGFATYAECLWEEFKTGSSDPDAYFSAVQSEKPSSVGDSVYVYPDETSDMSRIFSSNYSYRKGSWVLHQLRHVVGDAAFFDILTDYRAAFEFSAATTDDFIALASQSYGEDLFWFFDQWVYQDGAPAYEYGWQSTNIAGQDYLLVRIAQTQGGTYPAVFTMPVDLLVYAGGQQTLTVWNDARTQWFVLPIDEPAFEVFFDPNEWILRTAATTVTYISGPPKIIATTPAPGSLIATLPEVSEITVTFHTEVNVSQTEFSLVGQSTGARSFTIATTSNVNPVILSLDEPLPADTYTLTVEPTVTATVSGMQLDGEITSPTSPGAFPSGDGVPGGQAVLLFTVSDNSVPLLDIAGLLTTAILLATAAAYVLRRRSAAA